eukprot:3597571-Rhodomonas_salina.1
MYSVNTGTLSEHVAAPWYEAATDYWKKEVYEFAPSSPPGGLSVLRFVPTHVCALKKALSRVRGRGASFQGRLGTVPGIPDCSKVRKEYKNFSSTPGTR